MRLFGGSEQPESPECTPACSMCSMMPPIRTSSPSHTASTSTSMATSRKRSSSTGLSLETLHRVGHVEAQVLLGEHHFHGAAAEHVGGAHHQREADLARQLHRLLLVARGGVGRLLQPELLHQRLEALAVLGDVDRVGRGADDRRAGGLERPRQLQRRLAAELHDHPFGLLDRRGSRARPRASGARSTAGRRCRSRSRRSRGCS